MFRLESGRYPIVWKAPIAERRSCSGLWDECQHLTAFSIHVEPMCMLARLEIPREGADVTNTFQNKQQVGCRKVSNEMKKLIVSIIIYISIATSVDFDGLVEVFTATPIVFAKPTLHRNTQAVRSGPSSSLPLAFCALPFLCNRGRGFIAGTSPSEISISTYEI